MKQTILGTTGTAAVDEALKRLDVENGVGRLWDKDASLWSADSEEQDKILNRLGWMRVPQLMAADNERIKDLVKTAEKNGVRHVVLLGMGGSSLFADVCRTSFGPLNLGIPLSVLDTTDATQIRSVRDLAKPEETWVLVSSKSGTTAETLALYQHFWGWFEAAGLKAGEHCIAITDSGTSLQKLAEEKSFREIFVLDQSTGSDVGGRFAALTYFGLVPAALMGLDIDKLLASALGLYAQCATGQPMEDNQAAQLAAFAYGHAKEGRNKLSLLCSPAIAGFGTWAEQLVAESTGKKGQGIIPVVNEAIHPVEAYAKDRAFVEIQVAPTIDSVISDHIEALRAAGHPVLSIEWEDRYDLGAEVAKWSLATAWMGVLLGYNPFDEPNVWETKNKTNAFLADFAESGALEEGTPVLEENGVDVYLTDSSQVNAPGTVKEILAAFFDQIKPGDYLGLLNFLPRTQAIDESVVTMGNRLGQALKVAPTIEFGPRYLHSTGQLHKGGPNTGAFLVLTGHSEADLDIPGQPYDFNILKYAQALGDCQALADNGRRLLRLNLTGQPESVVQWLRKQVDDLITESASR